MLHGHSGEGDVFSVIYTEPDNQPIEVFNAYGMALITFPSGTKRLTQIHATQVLTRRERINAGSERGVTQARVTKVRNAMKHLVDVVANANARGTFFRRPVKAVEWVPMNATGLEQFGGWHGRHSRL
jgi:hypothetical protein